jgi:hypothetical protein
MALQLLGEGNSARGSASAAQFLKFAFLVIPLVVGGITKSSAREMRTATRVEHWHAVLSSGVLVSANLPGGTVGAGYSGKISAAGGTTPYSFSVVDGSLPSGLSLNSTTGYVTGIPTVAANKYAWVRVTDTKGLSGKLRIHVVINPGNGSTVSISITPTSASLASGGSRQFSANVQGANNTTVTWSASAGTISSTGYFTAPKVTTAATLTVRATSVADTTKRASATVAVTTTAPSVSVAVSPTSSSMTAGAGQQFTATVTGTSNTSVHWSTSSGSITDGGKFTAPAVNTATNVTVKATSAVDPTKSASALVKVAPANTTVSISVSPSSASVSAGKSQQFAASVQGTTSTSVNWSASGGSITSVGMFTAPNVSTSTSVTVTATSAADSTKKASANISVSPASTTPSALAITTASLPGAQAGNSYSYRLSATGGTTPYQWSVASGSLPSGFSFSTTGQLTGSTSQTGQFSFMARVTDASNNLATHNFAISIAPNPNTPTPSSGFDGPAELPRTYLQTAMSDTPAPGSTIPVSSGGSLQTALSNANCGDTILLQAGATFSGRFTFPAKACDDQHWIIVRTSASDSSLPAEGMRMQPCYAGVSSLPGRPVFNCGGTHNVLAVISEPQGNTSGPIILASGANHYRLLGLKITRVAGTGINYQYVSVPNGAADHIYLDRVWLAGTPQDENKNGINMSGITYGALFDSYGNDFHCISGVGACTDAKVVSGGNSNLSGGPYKITNNFLEASTEGILFGGGPATTTPADIEIRHNHFFKPLMWMPGQPNFVGGPTGNPFMVKNLLELKNAQRVLIEGNIFEYNWGGFSQAGYALLLTPKNQAGGCPICEVTDVTIRYNTFSHSGAGISMANVPDDNGAIGYAGEHYSLHDITLDDINSGFYAATPGSSSGTLFQVLHGWPNSALNSITINHVTGFGDPRSKIISLGNNTSYQWMYGFNLTNSIVGQALYPVWSAGGSSSCAAANLPLNSFNGCFTSWNFNHNAVIATTYGTSQWPGGNAFPTTPGAVQFSNFNNGKGGNYQLLSSSPYANAGSDGKDLGADINAIQAAIAGAY